MQLRSPSLTPAHRTEEGGGRGAKRCRGGRYGRQAHAFIFFVSAFPLFTVLGYFLLLESFEPF